MADVSLPGETGAFLMDDAVYDDDDDNVEARRPPAARQAGFDLDSGVGEEQKQKLRKLRSEQSKARKGARERSKAIRRQVRSGRRDRVGLVRPASSPFIVSGLLYLYCFCLNVAVVPVVILVVISSTFINVVV